MSMETLHGLVEHIVYHNENNGYTVLALMCQGDEVMCTGTMAMVNEGEYITNFEMAELFKMNRSLFETKSIAMKMVTELQNFRAKVDKDIEKSDNNRGDKRLLINQVVQSNLPEAFNLCIPIFKGTPKQTINVEVYISPSDFSCTLTSADVNDLLTEMRDNEMDAVLERIKAVCPDIVIIEQ